MGLGKDTIARIWRNHNLQPWRLDTFKVSNDANFEDKLVDVVGLYLNPRSGQWCSASMRRPGARPWTAPSSLTGAERWLRTFRVAEA